MANFRHERVWENTSEAIENDPLEKVLAARADVLAARSVNSNDQMVRTIVAYHAALTDFWWRVKDRAREEMTAVDH